MTCDRVRELASGYVLGALDTEEMLDVADHLDSCRLGHPEVDEFGGVLPYLAASLEPVEPPAWLRESVIAAAKADLVARRRVGKPSERRIVEPVAIPTIVRSPSARGTAAAAGQVVSLAAVRTSRRRRMMTWTMRVAAAVAILVLTGTGIVVQGNLAKALKAQQEDSKINYSIGQGARTAVMSATGGSKAGGIAVLMPSGHVILKLYGLAQTKNDEVYTVWLTTDKAGPTKVGSFTVDDSGVGYLEVDNVPTSASLLLYISMESNDKVTQPTGPIIVNGVVSL
ncbi:MAG: anti-sigma factor [Candidatus Limnocylindrales bacterium]